MHRIAVVDQRKLTFVTRQFKPENRTEAAIGGAGRSEAVGVASFIKIELGEIGARAKLAVFWTLEGRSNLGPGGQDGVEWAKPVNSGIVNGHPGRVEDEPIGMQVFHILREDVAIENNRVGGTGVRRHL